MANFGFRTVRGTIPVTAGHVVVDTEGTPTAAGGTLDATAIATGHRKRDADLRHKSQLLATGRWPAITFTTREITPTDGGWTVRGDLRVRDRTVGVQLTAHVMGVDGDAHRIRATTDLDRRDAGIVAPSFLIGHRVAITLETVLRPGAAARS